MMIRSRLTIVAIPRPLPGQQPTRVDPRLGDETQQQMTRDRATRFIVLEGPLRHAERMSQARRAVLAKLILADLAESARKKGLDSFCRETHERTHSAIVIKRLRLGEGGV